MKINQIKDINSIKELAKHDAILRKYAKNLASSMNFNQTDGEDALNDTYIYLDGLFTRRPDYIISGGLVSREIRQKLLKYKRNNKKYDLDQEDLIKNKFKSIDESEEVLQGIIENELLMAELVERAEKLHLTKHSNFILDCFRTNVSKASKKHNFSSTTGWRLFNSILEKLRVGENEEVILNKNINK